MGFPAVMRALARFHYDAWIDIEQDFTATSPGEACRTSGRYTREVLSRLAS
jgi:sugar phosphate isomerase/epimerase